MTDRPHDGRGHWLTTEELEIKLLRSIDSNLRSVRAMLLFWTIVSLVGAGLFVVFFVVAAEQASR